jgi:hypothetical protein
LIYNRDLYTILETGKWFKHRDKQRYKPPPPRLLSSFATLQLGQTIKINQVLAVEETNVLIFALAHCRC